MKIIPIHVHRFTSMSRTSSSQQLTIIQYENDKKKKGYNKTRKSWAGLKHTIYSTIVPCCSIYTQATWHISDHLSLVHLTDLSQFNTQELTSLYQRKVILSYMQGNHCPSIYIMKNLASGSSS
jgi:hypothetical protein